MKAIKIQLPRDLTMVEIVPFADIHIGDPLSDINLVREKIEYVKSNKNVYCILNGDLLNNSTKNSVGDVYSEALTPMQQLDVVIRLFEPIKDKILCVTCGNHEARTWKCDGVDLMGIACSQLGIEDRYAKESAFIFLRFGTSSRMKETNGSGNRRMLCYTLFVTHGGGGGRREGAKVNRLADMASIVDADIYVHSHTHLPMIMKQAFHRVDPRNSSIQLVDKLFVNTSAMLDYGGYGEAFEFKPASKDNPHILLCGTTKKFTAKL